MNAKRRFCLAALSFPVFIAGSGVSFGEECDGPHLTTVQRTQCVNAELDTDRKALSVAFDKAKKLSKDAESSQWSSLHDIGIALDDSQGSWIAYEQKQCTLETSLILGSGVAFGAPACEDQLVKARLAQLKDFNDQLSQTLAP